ncbi:hypothetical protein K439DRAFT_1660488 [Ramaria rubella]|nr:hypothetical protein K439DRAFT_1660488 [Ramaria rubella]
MANSISCAPPLLSRTTSSSIMSSLTNVSSTLPLSTSFLPWWKPSKHQSKHSPPKTWSLPSISHFDRQPSRTLSSTQWRESRSELLNTYNNSDPFDSYESSPVAGPSNPPSPAAPVQPPPTLTPATTSKWFWVGPHSSSQAMAEKTCEMVCYLWFSNTLGTQKSSPHRGRAGRRPRRPHSPSDAPSGLSDASTAALQFTPSTHFVHFMQKLLQTTQVSESVIVLSLHYIYRLKEENHFTNGQPGSEFRVAVVALMMANKFVDDNTYTNKTWSDVSGIELNEINKMEREFLLGVDFRLYVNTDTYKAWVNLLKGLVAVKERDEQQWHYSRRRVPGVAMHQPTPHHSGRNITNHQQRARSSSPLPSLKASYPFTFVASTYTNPFAQGQRPYCHSNPHASARPGVKRPAIVAFSPPSATLPGPPSKRPISLDMSVLQPSHGPTSAGSVYPLSAFAKLSLDKTDAPTRSSPAKPKHPVETPHTLAAPYSLQGRSAPSDPQNLYYYALASSPASSDNDNRARKALLRSHQPSSYLPPAYILPPPPQPMYVQSASTSPVHPLPPSRYLNLRPTHLESDVQSYGNPNSNICDLSPLSLPPIRVQRDDGDGQKLCHVAFPGAYAQRQLQPSRVPVAPFANAGPPGVHSQHTHYPYAPLPYALPQN